MLYTVIYNKEMKHALSALTLAALAAGCGTPDEGQLASEAADKFATAYFNYDFTTAMSLATPEGSRWLRFAASNIYEPDLEALRAKEADAEVSPSELETLGDTTATALVRVEGYMQRDTIGQRGRVVGEQAYRFHLVKRQGQWLVNLTEMPRPLDDFQK